MKDALNQVRHILLIQFVGQVNDEDNWIYNVVCSVIDFQLQNFADEFEGFLQISRMKKLHDDNFVELM